MEGRDVERVCPSLYSLGASTNSAFRDIRRNGILTCSTCLKRFVRGGAGLCTVFSGQFYVKYLLGAADQPSLALAASLKT